MNMKEIQVENTRYIYFSQIDSLPEESEIGLKIEGFSSFMKEHLDKSLDLRLVLIKTFFNPSTFYVYYLYWSNGQDLKELDQKVTGNTFTDEDFKASVKTVYQKTICSNCHSALDTLVIDTGDPYLGSPGLLQDKLRRSVFKQCPNCRESLRQAVVKIF
jgi:hypothetical protein